MKKSIIGLASIALSLSFATSAQAQIKFSDYPAKVYQGQKSTLKTNEYVGFRLGGKVTNPSVDFSGMYFYAVVGCGTGCMAHQFYGVRSGKEYNLDFELNPDVDCTDGSEGEVVIRPNSRLLIVKGLVDDASVMTTGSTGRCQVRFFVEKNGYLIRIK